MPRARPFQSNFSAGEFSPRLEGRVDISRYANAVATLENFVGLPHGGVKRRTGTHFVTEVKDSTKRVRLIPFEFSDTQAYVIELGDQYCRFLMNNGQILNDGGELVINGTFDTDIASWTDASAGAGAIAWEATAHALLVTSGAGTNAGKARQVVPITANHLGRSFRLRLTNNGPTNGYVSAGTTVGGVELLALTPLVPGLNEFTLVATTGSVCLEVGLAAGTSGLTMLVDAISLELIGDVAIYEIASPYRESDLQRIKFVQSADTMYLVHPDHPPQKLTRTGHADWTLIPVHFLPQPTTEEILKLAATLTPAAITGENIAFTASAAVFLAADVDRHIVHGTSRAVIQVVDSGTLVHADILDDFPDTTPIPSQQWGLNSSPHATATSSNKDPIGKTTNVNLNLLGWRAADVGKYIKMNDGMIKITKFTDANSVKGEIIKELTSVTGAIAGTWTLEVEAWSESRGFPATVTFHEGRLIFNATYTQPQTVWGSASGDFENFALGTGAGDSYEFTIAANKVNIGRWLLPSRVLLVGTKGGEFRVTGGADLPITPTNVDAKSETAYGSNFTTPVRVGAAVLFVQRSGRKLRELAFSLDFDSYVAPDLCVLSEHLFPVGKIIGEMDFQLDPDPVLWVVRSDGLLCGLSYDRSNDVVGWHRHPMDGAVESVCVIPHPDGDREQVWLSVRHTVQGVTKRYLEYQDDASGFYGDLGTDCALTYDGAPATHFGGLDHLRGKTVAIVGDGAYYGEQTVPATGTAEVVISPAASKVEVGLPFVSTLGTLRAEIPSQGGTSQGLKKRRSDIVVRVIETMGITINGHPKPARRSTHPLGAAPGLFTGDYDAAVLGWDTEARNSILQTLPFPANILGIFGTVDVAEF